MNKIIIRLSLAIFALGITNVIHAQSEKEIKKAEKAEAKRVSAIENWYNGGGTGMQTEAAYKLLKNKSSKTVIVAVIDSGIDIEHEDLQGKIWTNTDEIAGNGIDDDNNGYIDDVHGWNFLGNAKGENVNDIRLEMTRIYANLREKYEGEVNLENDEERAEYALYMEVKEEVESTRARYSGALAYYQSLYDNASEEDKAQFQGALDYLSGAVNYHYNPDHNGRALIGDNPDDFNDTNYGNNDVEGPDALHGTHVGGIIGANRANGIGYDGVANDVQLMSIRAVPNGDEFDKDIALAIRYAVDNGAQVINMSFGKAYSPHAQEVYEAFAYADSKGVLLVHAAGNDDKDIEEESNFPTPMYDFQKKKLDHWLEIGASTRYNKVKHYEMIEDKNGDPKGTYVTKYMLAAPFSNYSDRLVDVFAPGYEILNSVPQSEYQELQGTSMACPMVAGAAAFLKSYFPEMSMKEIKDVLLETAHNFTGTMHEMPGGQSRQFKADMVDFGKLSVTGSIIDLKAAVERCLEMHP